MRKRCFLNWTNSYRTLRLVLLGLGGLLPGSGGGSGAGGLLGGGGLAGVQLGVAALQTGDELALADRLEV